MPTAFAGNFLLHVFSFPVVLHDVSFAPAQDSSPKPLIQHSLHGIPALLHRNSRAVYDPSDDSFVPGLSMAPPPMVASASNCLDLLPIEDRMPIFYPSAFFLDCKQSRSCNVCDRPKNKHPVGKSQGGKPSHLSYTY